MIRRALCIAAMAIQFSTSGALQGFGQSSPADRVDQAVALMNQAHYPEAINLLETVLRSAPREFYAYTVLWESMQHMEKPPTLAATVRSGVKVLSAVPQSERTEMFYNTYEFGLELLGDEKGRSELHQQQLEQYPNGRAMQNLLLDTAAKTKDPIQAEHLYEDIVRRFPSAPGITAQANRNSFYLIRNHAGLFSKSQMLGAAERWQRSESLLAEGGGPPSNYVGYLNEMAEALLADFPASSLAYTSLAEQFIIAHWSETDLFDDTYVTASWPLELDARIKLKQWAPARRLGSRLEPLLEQGQLGVVQVSRSREAHLRSQYGLALEMTGSLSAAFEQFGVAWALMASRGQDMSEFLSRHQEFDQAMGTNLAHWRDEIAQEAVARDKRSTEELLAKQIHEPAQPFTVASFAGLPVTLAEQKRTLILVLWASWCGFCGQELSELQRLSDTDAGKTFSVLAISVDTDRDAAHKFVEGKSLTFPIAFSDGKMDAFYKADVIPQLFVIDSDGMIRFHLSGTQPDLIKSLRTIVGYLNTDARQQQRLGVGHPPSPPE